MPIRILDPATVNKIAAGEVIERPASALKELLENSADSGASRIEIDFDGGGKRELKVTDDGHGMSAQDLPLSLHPHATSKIEKIEDLGVLKTFGFRGEALASLAAVSELSIHSSLRGHDDGSRIVTKGGEAEPVSPAPPIGGTQIVVKNLFYNVPARQKFLKSDAGETAAIKKVVRAFALSHPDLTLTLRQNGKALFHWERESFEKRSCRVLELDAKQTVAVRAEAGGFDLQAVLGLPEATLPTQQGLWVFVQDRPVTDRTVQQAVFEGYRNLVMNHQYPRAVISLKVDPSIVDVNVHPAKAQVKFVNAGTVFHFVSSEIKKALARYYESRSSVQEISLGLEGESVPMGSPREQENLIREAVTQFNQRSFQSPTSFQRPASQSGSGSAFLSQDIATISTGENPALPFEANLGVWSSLQVVGQFSNTYLVCQSPKALILIDQHAAHERVLFERLKKQWTGTAPSGVAAAVEKQPALLEDIVTLPRENIEALTEGPMAEVFEKMGFELVDRGPESLAVVSRPAFLLDVSLKPLLERLSEQVLDMGSSGVLQDLLTDLWASMACHGAIRAGRVLATEEMVTLLSQMDEFAFSSFCPHGRPVSVQWTTYELEKLFKRIV